MNIFLPAFTPENLVSRDGFDSPVPRQPAHLRTQQAECGAFLRESFRVPRRRPFTYFKSSYAIGSVPSLSGHATAYRWRSLPRVHRHRANKPQGSSERVLSWQVTTDQLICASLSHTHYWYEVGKLKIPAIALYIYMYIPCAMVSSKSSLVLLCFFSATNLLCFVFMFLFRRVPSLFLTLVVRPLDLSCQETDDIMIKIYMYFTFFVGDDF